MKKSTVSHSSTYASPAKRPAKRSSALNFLPAAEIPKQYRRISGKGRFPAFYPDLNISLVSEKLECSQGYISSLLRGEKEGSMEFLSKLAGLLKLDVSELQKIRRRVAQKLMEKPKKAKASRTNKVKVAAEA